MKKQKKCKMQFFSCKCLKTERCNSCWHVYSSQRNLTAINRCIFSACIMCQKWIVAARLRCVFPVQGQTCLPDLSLTLTMCPHSINSSQSLQVHLLRRELSTRGESGDFDNSCHWLDFLLVVGGELLFMQFAVSNSVLWLQAQHI